MYMAFPAIPLLGMYILMHILVQNDEDTEVFTDALL